MSHLMKLFTTLIAAMLAVTTASAQSPAAAPWVSLFNGQDYTGWKLVGPTNLASAEIEDGAMVLRQRINTVEHTFVSSAEKYGDFILELDLKDDPGFNSGILLRCMDASADAKVRLNGYQVKIDNTSRAWTGGVFDDFGDSWRWLHDLKDDEAGRAAFKLGEWAHFRIECFGDTIKVWVNGVPTCHLQDAKYREGQIAFKIHSLGDRPNDTQSVIRLKNIRIITEQPERFAQTMELPPRRAPTEPGQFDKAKPRSDRAGEKMTGSPPKLSRESVVIYYDNTEPSIEFSAQELQKSLSSVGHHPATLKSLVEMPVSPDACYVVIAKNNSDSVLRLLETFGGQKTDTMGAEAYALRKTDNNGKKGYWAIGGDRIGAMYGGIHIGELASAGSLEEVVNCENKPYIAKRGMKFNIPLDKRQPSFDDNGTSGRENFKHVWDLNYWKEYLDTIAKQRYNVLSLWNRHPFPTLVKVPGYEDVALDDVYDKDGKLIKKMSHSEKIIFWQQVMDYAQDRGIDVWWYVWNIHVYGSEGTDYGLTDSPDNATTKDYVRKSVTQLFLTYPKLTGLGMCPGENFGDKNKDHDFKEQWCWDVYGQGILDYKKLNPDREIGFVHRYWLTDYKYIGNRFNKLPDGFDLEYKYSRARLYSAPNPPFAKKDVLDVTPPETKTWWNLRNDDIFLVRWGDPEYVKQTILNFPGDGRTAGYVWGSDRFCWGRESASKNPTSPRQLENDKHWYSFLLWGRLGYDPDTSPQLLTGLIKNRYQLADGTALYDSWQSASQIIPLVNRTRYVPWDYMWWVEGCKGNLLDKSIQGFHTVNIFLDERWGSMEGSGIIGIPDFVSKNETSGTTPLQVATQLEELAEKALTKVSGIDDGGNVELRETLGDIRTQARLGQYYAAKIRGTVALGFYRKSGESQHQKDAVAYLNSALSAWRNYAKELDANYTNKLYISGQKVFDWFDETGPQLDIAIAEKG